MAMYLLSVVKWMLVVKDVAVAEYLITKTGTMTVAGYF